MMPVSVSKCSGSGPAPAPAAAAASSRAQALAPFVASTFTPPNLLRQLPGEGGIGAPPPPLSGVLDLQISVTRTPVDQCVKRKLAAPRSTWRQAGRQQALARG